ncbi:muscarinic acetylcholine receptor DM1 isoform X2 [Chelonus insularis]|uniref:muscarinic acetylcholine receptor DM1 isoform X2 n=1 Tax=Chelonus insularis TaxID=460826 RepID=UPI0015884943|nr:muscarinic acetylcholine receptor DM1 isoform X2 [Chelonus insularis]
MNVTKEVPISQNYCNGSESSEVTQYKIWETVLITIVAFALSVITVIGNIMVMVSFKIDKQLQTISNYFLFSLAIADFAIGLISMPLFTIYTLLGYWPLGAHVCDTWLALDYLASNASVLNLLIISFDRYFSVTRPLTYRAMRTPRKAAAMIGGAWGVSLLLWPPWIYAWPYLEGKRTVPDNECYIQFIETNHYITFGTAIAAFYVPVTVMIFLYWRIWRETEKRKKDLTHLQEGGKQDANYNSKHRPFSWTSFKKWCIAWWHSGREEDDEDDEIGGTEVSSRTVHPEYEETLTPISVETPFTSIVSQYPSLSGMQCTDRQTLDGVSGSIPTIAGEHHDYKKSQTSSSQISKNVSGDPIYRIVIKLPTTEADVMPSITMYEELMSFQVPQTSSTEVGEDGESRISRRVDSLSSQTNTMIRRPSQMPDVRLPLNTKNITKGIVSSTGKGALNKPQNKKKKRTQDKKAAKTLSAILAAFVITWTPYNILVLLKPLTKACVVQIPQELWSFFYYLCYINSTVNPVCYALCNATFRRTYVRILKCKWHNRNRSAGRGYCP